MFNLVYDNWVAALVTIAVAVLSYIVPRLLWRFYLKTRLLYAQIISYPAQLREIKHEIEDLKDVLDRINKSIESISERISVFEEAQARTEGQIDIIKTQLLTKTAA
jgi:peptidoglycan hydrolase CwlO-like protein